MSIQRRLYTKLARHLLVLPEANEIASFLCVAIIILIRASSVRVQDTFVTIEKKRRKNRFFFPKFVLFVEINRLKY